jgi:PBP1b-binding outer membrane lipoprotein LpoB
MKRLKTTLVCSLLLSGCSQREQAIQSSFTEKQPNDKPQSSLPSLETLMPKFEVRSNAPNDYRVAFMAHDQTNWQVVNIVLLTREDAEAVIVKSKAQLEMKYEIGKQLSDSLSIIK